MRLEKYIAIVALTVLSVVVSFTAGVWMTNKNLWPTNDLAEVFSWVDRYLETGTLTPENRVFVPDYVLPDNPVNIAKGSIIHDGYFAVMAWYEADKEYGIRLLDFSGTVVHYWPIDYMAYDQDGPRNQSDQPHGMLITADGSAVIVFDKGDVMVRIDQCGEPEWIRKGIFHHLVSQDDDGSLWVWEGEHTPIAQFQKIVNIDVNDGSTLSSIDLVEDVIRKHEQWQVFGLTPGFEFQSHKFIPKARPHDIFHPNDVEPLTKLNTEKFPIFETGDLLVSMRKPNLVAVLDKSGKVKWSQSGPWIAQHDADFQGDGTITLFNNRASRKHSSLMSVDPVSGETRTLFEQSNDKFYSRYMGAHQKLPHDGFLVVIPAEGKVIELDKDGNVLFEFINLANRKAVGHVQNAVWLDKQFFDQLSPCH